MLSHVCEALPAVRSMFRISDGQIQNIKSIFSIRLLDILGFGNMILQHDLGFGQLRCD